MTRLRHEIMKKTENNITKDIINLFRLQKYIDDTIIKDMSNLFRLEKENEAIKNNSNKRY